MPNCCCAPGCSIGYKPRKKKKKNVDINEPEEIDNITHSLFKFPRDPELRAK